MSRGWQGHERDDLLVFLFLQLGLQLDEPRQAHRVMSPITRPPSATSNRALSAITICRKASDTEAVAAMVTAPTLTLPRRQNWQRGRGQMGYKLPSQKTLDPVWQLACSPVITCHCTKRLRIGSR